MYTDIRDNMFNYTEDTFLNDRLIYHEHTEADEWTDEARQTVPTEVRTARRNDPSQRPRMPVYQLCFSQNARISRVIQSLSGTAHCYDNARMESFFAILKKEKLYQLPTCRMKREEVKTAIFRCIFGYYNTKRINSFNKDGLPPVALRSSTGLAHHAA